jgi:hypothetical protein
MAILRRSLTNNEPLIGDLLEEFDRRRSHVWLWRQVVAAIWLDRRRHREIRPLRLVDGEFISRQTWASRAVTPRRSVNLTASPVPGVGGLGVLALGTLVTLVSPQVWWAVLYASLAGVTLGATMIFYRRRRLRSRPASDTRCVLLTRT